MTEMANQVTTTAQFTNKKIKEYSSLVAYLICHVITAVSSFKRLVPHKKLVPRARSFKFDTICERVVPIWLAISCCCSNTSISNLQNWEDRFAQTSSNFFSSRNKNLNINDPVYLSSLVSRSITQSETWVEPNSIDNIYRDKTVNDD